ncbi:MAG: M28 family peptidase [Xanthomonadales bacterium]|nr:M28 family peptidase [Xanthomonadales bacterium]
MRPPSSFPSIPGCRVSGVALLAAATLCLSACQPAEPPEQTVAEAVRVQAHVAFLADDLLEGREAGTRGYDLAARYVASQMAAIGLQPAGDNGGWLQRVPLLRGTRIREGAQMRVHRADGVEELRFEQDFLPGVNYQQATAKLRAPAVFVGQAVVAPEFDHDDLAGVDLHGKIALLLSGAPEGFPNDPRAYYSSSRVKLQLLVERGAVGVVFLLDPEREGRSPWARGAANWARPGMRLRDPEGRPVDSYPELKVSASLSLEASRALLANAQQSADEVYTRLKSGQLQAFDLDLELEITAVSALQALESSNVVGLLPGSDPALRDEYLVYSAHLDHVGIGAPVNGDRIYNGALDNALGTAVMLETARLAAGRGPARRSQLFVAVTAEEKGLLGSQYFAEYPTVNGRLVANINIDMPVILTELSDVLPIGIEHSSLAAVVRDSAAQLGIALSPDPNPEEVVFVRSDQFNFIRRGIPAIYLKGGIVASDPAIDGKQLATDFRRTHYHQPSDQIDLPIHYPTAARMADLNASVGAAVASAAQAPNWNQGDFFGERFAGERR